MTQTRDEAIARAVSEYINTWNTDELLDYVYEHMIDYFDNAASDEEIDNLLEDYDNDTNEQETSR